MSAPPDLEKAVLVGIIIAPHGVEGVVSAEKLSDNPRRFQAGAEFFDEQGRSYFLQQASVHRGRLLLSLRGVTDRDAAEKLRGTRLYIVPKAEDQPPDGTYYHYQLSGLEVRQAGEKIGVIEEILTYAANDVFLVRKPDGREILVPALKQMVKKVDIKGGYMEVELPEGLS
ncbi:MAG: 16S rRNA processing protein RimM [Clostridia bacterium]|nr:16S rRNA processing protein RimM [Clostridia bacterium]